jgi:uncharacterized protein (DUF433 family)
MATYLLTWNPDRWPWGDLADEARLVRLGNEQKGRWSCGNNTQIRPGDRFFLLRQGKPPRGIVGSGRIVSAPFRDRHWDGERRKKGIEALYVEIVFERLLDPAKQALLGLAELTRGPLGAVHWRTQMSGIRIPDDAADLLEKLWRDHASNAMPTSRRNGAAVVQEEPEAGPLATVDETELLRRITVNPRIFGGKPIIRNRRLAVEHVLGMLAAGDTRETLLESYAWLEPEDIQACLVYARRMVANERIEPLAIQRS